MTPEDRTEYPGYPGPRFYGPITLDELKFAMQVWAGAFTGRIPVDGEAITKKSVTFGDSTISFTNIPENRAAFAIMDAFKEDDHKGGNVLARIMCLLPALDEPLFDRFVKRFPERHEALVSEFALRAVAGLTFGQADFRTKKTVKQLMARLSVLARKIEAARL